MSHKPIVDDLRGHNYKPYSYRKEYLPKMKSALYAAPKPKEPVPVVIALCIPRCSRLAATQANGTHPYFVPPEHTAKVRAAIGLGPMICEAHPDLKAVEAFARLNKPLRIDPPAAAGVLK